MGDAKKKDAELILDADELEADTFVGTIVSAIVIDDETGNKRVAIEVQTEFSEEPWRIPKMKVTKRRNSMWGAFLQGLAACNVELKKLDDLKGQKFKFERRDLKLGRDVVIEGFPVPVEYLGEDKD